MFDLVKSPFRTGTPKNGSRATAVLTFSDAPTDANKIIIGDEVYEFDNDDIVDEGSIPVLIENLTIVSDIVEALVDVVNENSLVCIAVIDNNNSSIVNFGSKTVGGNDITKSVMCNNASWNTGETFTGGAIGTYAEKAGICYIDDDYVYVSIALNSESDSNWRRASLSEIF